VPLKRKSHLGGRGGSRNFAEDLAEKELKEIREKRERTTPYYTANSQNLAEPGETLSKILIKSR